MQVFFPLVQYSVLLELDQLPEPGDKIVLTKQNLVSAAGGVDGNWFGQTLTVGEQLADQGWANHPETVYPSFSPSWFGD